MEMEYLILSTAEQSLIYCYDSSEFTEINISELSQRCVYSDKVDEFNWLFLTPNTIYVLNNRQIIENTVQLRYNFSHATSENRNVSYKVI